MAGPSSPGQEGPTDIPPPLPEGWLAQWDGSSRKYYYVQRATGHSQWEIPTKPALSAPTPEPTPQGVDPFGKPIDTRPAADAEYTGQDRSLLGDLAMGALGGGKQNKQSSGLGGIAQTLLSGGSKPSGGQTPTNLGSQLLSSFMGGSKPQGQQHTPSYQGGASQNPQSQHHGGHGQTGGLLGGLLHGHHGQHQQDSNYGYNPGQSSGSSSYHGQAPPSSYTPTGQSGSFGPSSGPYHPLGSTPQANTASQNHSQGQATQTPQGSNSYASQSTPQPYSNPQGQSYQSPPPSQYQGSNPSTPAYAQPSAPYMSTPSSGFGQYGQQSYSAQQQHQNQSAQHGQQQQQQQQQHVVPHPAQQPVQPNFTTSVGQGNQTPNFPPPPSHAPPQGYHTGPPSFPPPPSSAQMPQYYSQQHSSQSSNAPGFATASSQYGQQAASHAPNFPPPPSGQQGASHSQSHNVHQQQGYSNSPAPPMQTHPSNHGFQSGAAPPPSSAGHAFSSHAQTPTAYSSSASDPYVGNFPPPPAPSWR